MERRGLEPLTPAGRGNGCEIEIGRSQPRGSDPFPRTLGTPGVYRGQKWVVIVLSLGALRGTLHAMKKTSLYLDDGDVERVRRLAQREGRSQADVVRAALAAYESQLVAQRRFSLTGSAEGDGQSVADLPEEDLLQGFGN